MNLQNVKARAGYLLISACIGLTSCISSKELVLYQANGSGSDLSMTQVERYIPTIKAGDVLSVQVSSLSPEATTYFNPYGVMQAMSGSQTQLNAQTTPFPFIPGYTVSEEGQIELPLVGKQMIKGLTNSQAAASIKEKLLDYLKEPTVNVRNMNFQISVLGEVARPSHFLISTEQITLPAALGLAGDITIQGQRNNVLIIREENGQRTFNRVDLTKRDVFKSSYYYLHPNDVVYVEPGKARIANADRTYQILPIAISALSLLTIIISRI
jgi:polysaccharide export outer membrane protein